MLPFTVGPEKKLLRRTDLEVVFSILCGHGEEDEEHDLYLQTSTEFLTLRVGRSQALSVQPQVVLMALLTPI